MNKSLHSARVAFQGEHGAFSEEAAIVLLGDGIQLVPRPTFEQLFAAVEEGVADYALAPLENSLAGSVHRSYDLLLNSSLVIIAEVIIPIAHHLIGCSTASFDVITTVESHPVALAQCERFLALNPQIKRLATDDTAASVRRVVEQRDPTRAAVAGRRAAEVYGGLILREHLEDHPENYTRFVLLAGDMQHAETMPQADKLSLAVKLSHQPGALARALAPFAERGIDLLKIESRPAIGSPWQYHFYLDLQGSIDQPGVRSALTELQGRADEVRILGCYPSAAGKNVQQQTYVTSN